MRLATLRGEGNRLALAFVEDETRLVLVEDQARAAGVTLDPALLDPRASVWLTPAGQAALRPLAARTGAVAPVDLGRWRFAPAVPNPGKIIAVGRNYMDHVREGQEIWAKRGKTIVVPAFPTAFAKFPSSLSGPYDDIVKPAGLDDIDYEVELAVVIGQPALDVGEREALGYVAGYCICNDLATRGIQRLEMEAQIGITLAKNYPGFAPLGPWLTTVDEVPDPQALGISLLVDGDVRQQASTRDMIFSVATLVAYWSKMGLQPGDVIITGTPSGVALARPEPEKWYLRAGQVVVARVEGLGELRNRIR